MKKISAVFVAFLLLTNCAVLQLLQKNQAPYFLDAFIPMHQSEMISYTGLRLNWDAQDPEGEELYYNVFFAKVGEPLKQMSRRQTETYFQLFFPLEAETSYQWKIVVTDGRNSIESHTLEFKTSYYLPTWWNKQSDSNHVFYFGVAAHELQRYAFSLAEDNAKRNQNEFLADIVQRDMNQFMTEAAVFNETLINMANQVVKIVANHEFKDVAIDLQETKTLRRDFYRTYVRMTIPRSEYEKKLLSTIRSARFLYDELSFSQSFRQLDISYK